MNQIQVSYTKNIHINRISDLVSIHNFECSFYSTLFSFVMKGKKRKCQMRKETDTVAWKMKEKDCEGMRKGKEEGRGRESD